MRTTTGLERLLASELAESGHSVDELSKRQLVVCPADESILTDPPQLADDLFIETAGVPDPGGHQASLARAVETLATPTVHPAHQLATRTLAVSASFTGRRNYSRFDIEDAVGNHLSHHGAGEYFSRRGDVTPPRGSQQWRVTLDGRMMRVGVRPFATPLHRRPWRRCTVLGSIHPPVAAAMGRLARIENSCTVLDPCCGAGTVVVEAYGLNSAATYIGGDIEPEAIAIAAENSVGLPVQWYVGDAGDLGLPSGSVDRIVTNPPWGVRRQAVDLTGLLTEWRRVLRSDGLLVVLLNEAQHRALSAHPGWKVTTVYPVSIAGQHVRIILARSC
ncbi:hypothetical protein GCM10027416_00600 [Okibacterium endophyticum]